MVYVISDCCQLLGQYSLPFRFQHMAGALDVAPEAIDLTIMGLENLYREIILDHYRSPRNKGELPPPAHRVEGFNPLCGDEIILTIEVDDSGTVTDLKIGGQGCSISQASASMMTAAVKGTSADDARKFIAAFKEMMNLHENQLDGSESNNSEATDSELKLGDLEALKGVVKFPVRIKCATLGWNTLAQALDELEAS